MTQKKAITSSSRFLFFSSLSILACFFPLNCHSRVLLEEKNDEIKGMFVFGSSLVDNGNNNFLPKSRAKANYSPYGIDFPYGPSGRFTNGKNVIDLICDQLGLPLIPTFSDPTTKGIKIIYGVNFASGSSGILDQTGSLAGEVITLNQQVRNFKKVTLPELEGLKGQKSKELLANYLFVVGTGGNDYSFNYFLKPSDSSGSLQVFTSSLINSLSMQLTRLYNLGGRKFVLMAVNPLGCYPFVRTNNITTHIKNNNNTCIEALNSAADLFNAQLKSLVNAIKPEMPASHIVFVNSYNIILDIIQNPISQGFNNTSNACCELGSARDGGNFILCKKDGQVCEERSNYVFFDGLHPTEAVNILIATKAFNSSLTSEVYPINVKQLAKN